MITEIHCDSIDPTKAVHARSVGKGRYNDAIVWIIITDGRDRISARLAPSTTRAFGETLIQMADEIEGDKIKLKDQDLGQ